MEHEGGAFKVNCQASAGAVKKAPETAVFPMQSGINRTLQRKKYSARNLDNTSFLPIK
jgi:hypothetical protein